MPYPDDMHLHLRDQEEMHSVLEFSARQFARAVIMPNLQPPVHTCEQALQYRQRILDACPEGLHFEPLMTLYLSDATPVQEIARLARTPGIVAVKYYPAGATTYSEQGVRHIERLDPVLEAMQKHDVPLLIHGEVTGQDVDIFDREARFIDQILVPLRGRFPQLRMVLEHISTREAVDFINAAGEATAATITPQHLLLNRNALFQGGLQTHHYCLPVLQAEAHRRAVIEAATSGSPRYFLGTDSAPHPRRRKECPSACAGVFSAPAALALYAEAFDAAGQLARLPAFAAHHGADFYHLARNTARLRLDRKAWTIPTRYPCNGDQLVPLGAGQRCTWQVNVT